MADKKEEVNLNARDESLSTMCVACSHPFHFSRCFATIDVGRAFTQCRCKKGVREDAS